MLSYFPLKTRHILWMDGFLRIKRRPSWHKIRRCGRSTCWGLVWPLTEEIRVKEDFLREVLRRKLFGNSEPWIKFEAWSTPGSENGASKIANGELDLGYSWIVHFQINPPLFKLRQSSSNLIICRSSFRSSFGEDRVTGLGWAFIWASKDCGEFISLGLPSSDFLDVTWGAVGIILCGYNYDNNSYTLENMQDVSSMMFPR